MSWLFISGGKSIRDSASASVLLMNIQGWFPLGLTGLISLLSKGLSRVFASTTVWKHQFFDAQPSYDPTLTSVAIPDHAMRPPQIIRSLTLSTIQRLGPVLNTKPWSSPGCLDSAIGLLLLLCGIRGPPRSQTQWRMWVPSWHPEAEITFSRCFFSHLLVSHNNNYPCLSFIVHKILSQTFSFNPYTCPGRRS